MSFNLVALASVVVLVAGEEYYSDLDLIDSIYYEAPCLQSGGLCVLAADCPQGMLTKKTGLCAEQQARGVECCHGMSVKETRCSKQGGACMPSAEQCPVTIHFLQAKDCSTDEKCCVYL